MTASVPRLLSWRVGAVREPPTSNRNASPTRSKNPGWSQDLSLGRAYPDAVRPAVGRLQPDCVLLDGDDSDDYGLAWKTVAWLGTRERHLPVIMFTTNQKEMREAREVTSARSHAAHFDAVLNNRSDLDELVHVVDASITLGMLVRSEAE